QIGSSSKRFPLAWFVCEQRQSLSNRSRSNELVAWNVASHVLLVTFDKLGRLIQKSSCIPCTDTDSQPSQPGSRHQLVEDCAITDRPRQEPSPACRSHIAHHRVQ